MYISSSVENVDATLAWCLFQQLENDTGATDSYE